MPDFFKDPEIFRTVLGSLQTGVYLMDRERKIHFWNDGAERITGYLRHEVLGHSCRDILLNECDEHGCSSCQGVCPVRHTLLDGKKKGSQMYFHHKDGRRIAVHVWTVPIRDEQGTLIGAAESFECHRAGTFEKRRAQDSLASYGCLDETTGIPNLEFTQFHLRENLTGFKQYKVPFSILLTRVEDIYPLKMKYGREAVDTILGLVARNLKNTLRPTDFLGRWSDDKFLAIALNCEDQGMKALVDRIRRVLHYEGIQWWGDELRATTCLGYATVRSGDTVDTLLERVEFSLMQHRARAATAGSGKDSNS
ncbi:MAG TPA: PAS domain-containing protein [Terriglobales bacterium]|jgi:PAS domain S-box-containing protein/diguanylate cyclase (GGDEF)-like protein